MAPLDRLFDFAKLDGRHLELPNDDHLIVASAGQVVSIWGESHHVDSGGVPSLQVILVLGLIPMHSCRFLLLLIILSRSLAKELVLPKRRRRCLIRDELPKSDASVEFVDLAARYQVLRVWEEVQRHYSC